MIFGGIRLCPGMLSRRGGIHMYITTHMQGLAQASLEARHGYGHQQQHRPRQSTQAQGGFNSQRHPAAQPCEHERACARKQLSACTLVSTRAHTHARICTHTHTRPYTHMHKRAHRHSLMRMCRRCGIWGSYGPTAAPSTNQAPASALMPPPARACFLRCVMCARGCA